MLETSGFSSKYGIGSISMVVRKERRKRRRDKRGGLMGGLMDRRISINWFDRVLVTGLGHSFMFCVLRLR